MKKVYYRSKLKKAAGSLFKVPNFIFMFIILLTIGFASITTNLVMDGTISFAFDGFDVIFSYASLEDDDSGDVTISEDGHTLTLTTISDKDAVVNYRVKNTATQYDANVSITCTEEGGTATETFDDTTLPMDTTTTLEAQESKTGTISVSKKKLYDTVKSLTLGTDTDNNIDYSEISSDTNGKGVYTLSSIADDDYPVYFYRGEVDNNLLFAGFCWKIVRTTGTGGTKLIYNGEPTDGTCDNTGEDTQIGTSAFNESYDDNAYVGYMYGTAGSSTYAATHANTNDSTIKKVLDEWYENNLLGTKYEYLIADIVYRNDRSMASSAYAAGWGTSYTQLGYGTNPTVYAARERFDYSSPYIESANDVDEFSVTYESGNGNGNLTYPIGLITMDEVMLAGGDGGGDFSDNTSYYLYTDTDYWTMTPSVVNYEGAGYALVFFVNKNGDFRDQYYQGVADEHGVRPYITVSNSTMIYSGTGTESDPYTTELTVACTLSATAIERETTVEEQAEYTFDYTGSEQTYVVSASGYYKLETWGAQGGSYSDDIIGGYGGYSVGTISLTEGDILYINVGGTTSSNAGGYNGGGTGGTGCSGSNCTYNLYSGGGGATHIATKSGLLSTLEDYQDIILIVAGGGGGSYAYSSDFYTNGGNGGGYIGNSGGAYALSGCSTGVVAATGGTQAEGGSGNNSYTAQNGSFGAGGNGESSLGTGGGAGFYGGGGTRNIGCSAEGGGGGSGYIGNSLLSNKVMYCYECEESTERGTYTVSTVNVSSTATSYYAKSGNGYAKITYLGTTNSEKKLNIYMGSGVESIYYSTDGSTYISSNENTSLSLDEDTTVYYYGVASTNYTMSKCTSSSPCSVTVTEDTTVSLSAGVSTTTFDYTGAVQTYTAVAAGYYQLEVWGAQGGSVDSTYYGGYGGYATGVVKLSANEVLYIVVGGAGSGSTEQHVEHAGGYNGGGTVYSASSVNHQRGSGGGATHIATETGLLSSLSSSTSSVLIVAGGGGGGRNQSNHTSAARWGQGGAGGGYIGQGAVSSYGSTTSYTTVTANAGSQTSGFAFGKGQDDNQNAGGGGGWYGGWDGGSGSGQPGGYAGSGSGGSGYIANSSLVSYGSITKHMYCYSCSTSSSASTLTYSTTNVSSSATSNYAKSGNGYAKITYLGQ